MQTRGDGFLRCQNVPHDPLQHAACEEGGQGEVVVIAEERAAGGVDGEEVREGLRVVAGVVEEVSECEAVGLRERAGDAGGAFLEGGGVVGPLDLCI